MCRRSQLVGFVLIAAGVGVIVTIVIPEGIITVLFGLILLGCGCLCCRRH